MLRALKGATHSSKVTNHDVEQLHEPHYVHGITPTAPPYAASVPRFAVPASQYRAPQYHAQQQDRAA
eukprot:2786746-Rhodomonas_salina.2